MSSWHRSRGLGHAAGDVVLLEIAKRLDESIRPSDTAARFGGDEFAVLLEDVGSAQDAAVTAERILESLAAPLLLEGKELSVRCSLGISIADGDSAAGADQLIRNADAAMYIAKRDGKGGYRLFEPAMHEGVLERLELRADLQRAMAAGQLELYYQPILRLSDGSVNGVEALLRWHHPERGMVGRDTFIPLAEEMGLIVPMGRWVLHEACRQARPMQALLPADTPFSMSVNLSVKQLQHPDIVADVSDALAESGFAHSSLTLEITETVMMADTDLAVQRLAELKQLGVQLALDDFGTGYSSLSYLSRFPVDILKMDRSFLRDGALPQSSPLTSTVIALGETLELEVVAEGIEHPEQWLGLRDLGCGSGQGFLFARPMDAGATLEYLRADATAGRGCPSCRPSMRAVSGPLTGKVALVTGATRGAGRGTAVSLGEAGATVYCTGRTTSEKRSDYDRAGTIEETAELVDAAGGEGIAVAVDHLDPAQVEALVGRIDAERGRLDVLVNDIWGGEQLAEWNTPIWEHDLDGGLRMLRLAIDTHLITSHFALALLIRRPGGLVVEMTDGTAEYNAANYRLSTFYDLATTSVIRLAFSQGKELEPHGRTAVALTPGMDSGPAGRRTAGPFMTAPRS